MNDYEIVRDSQFLFNKQFVPNRDFDVHPFPWSSGGPRNRIASNGARAEIHKVGDSWRRNVSLHWSFKLTQGTREVYTRAGVVYCWVCVYFERLTRFFDMSGPGFKFGITSEQIKFVGVNSVRYFMPGGNRHNFVKFLFMVPYIIESVVPEVEFEVRFESNLYNGETTDGALQLDDRFNTDVHVQFEEERGRISLEGF